MCLAIAPVSREQAGRLQRLWRPLSASPLRLLAFGAALHGLFVAWLAATGRLPDAAGVRVVLYHGIAGSVLLGFLLTWLPARLRREPVHYAAYTTVWFLMLTGMGLLEAGLWQGQGWRVAGALLLLLAWVLALRTLYWIALREWGRPGRVLRALLATLAAGAAGIPLYAIALLADSAWLLRYPHGPVWLVAGTGALAALCYLAWHRDPALARPVR